MDFKKTLSARVDRRKLLRNLGVVGAGAVLTACGPRGVTPPPDNGNGNGAPDRDAAILNFALNLEYLEAAFYLAAVGRLDLLPGSADIVLPDGVLDSNPSEAWETEVREFAEELAQDELDHVLFLRSALDDAAADRPTLNFRDAFAGAAAAAFDLDADTAAGFDPFADPLLFLHGTFVFEDVGVTAYNGAAPLITKSAVLAPAAGILAVEAYHSGAVRSMLYDRRDVETPFGMPVSAVVQGISDLRASVGGGKDQGILQPEGRSIVSAGSANLSVTDENGIAFARTPREVANIVFLSSGQAMGGFFPDGLEFPAEFAADVEFLLSL
jgi:hypothetical protein